MKTIEYGLVKKRYVFVHGDIGESDRVAKLRTCCRPRDVVDFAAESHVDRSIHGPEDFIQTHIIGTFRHIDVISAYWNDLDSWMI